MFFSNPESDRIFERTLLPPQVPNPRGFLSQSGCKDKYFFSFFTNFLKIFLNIFLPNSQQHCKSAIYISAENSALRGPQANNTPRASRRTTPPRTDFRQQELRKAVRHPRKEGRFSRKKFGRRAPRTEKSGSDGDRNNRKQEDEPSGEELFAPLFFRKKRRKILQGDRTARRFSPLKEAGSLQRAKRRDGFGLDAGQKRRRRPLYK